jgi:tRNA U34 2-thiouridine synthase MnmA/TrmU
MARKGGGPFAALFAARRGIGYNNSMKVRALGLLSGGLDSSLAALLLMEQGIEVRGLYFNTGFCLVEAAQRVPRRGAKRAVHHGRKFTSTFEIPMEIVDIREEYLRILRHPKHGYGSGFNPCIDCRIFMLQKARAIMEREGWDFIFTGEVLGQRPMTQMPRPLKLIERAAGLEGLIVRPLCAKQLPPTRAELEGKVDRERLLDISGRRRIRQMELAARFGLTDYPTPSGGCCFLTDPHLKWRFLDLVRHRPIDDVPYRDFFLLKFGRHFRLSPAVKLIVGREESENEFLMERGEGFILLRPESHTGPFALLEPGAGPAELGTAAGILASYCTRAPGTAVTVAVERPGGERETVAAPPLPEEAVEAFRIAKETVWKRKN